MGFVGSGWSAAHATFHGLVDQAGIPWEVVADDRRGRAADEERVGPEAAGDLGDDRGGRALDEEAVVAFGAVHLDLLDVDEVDVQPAAEHAVPGDDEVV